tara:strand:+ start:21908 stop:22450 length:543 start_codon:yes stop_codon:yes gene_type:complete
MTIKAEINFDPRVKLKAKRTLDGNIIIFDHEDIDIVLIPEKRKCLTFPKKSMSDKVYSAQDRMFNFMFKKGIVDNSTIRGGNIFGSMEAEILESKVSGVDSIQAFLFVLNEYIDQERPYFRRDDVYDDARLDNLLRPSDEESTELGDVPQATNKGSHDPSVRPYGFQYNYSLVRESESED